MIQWGPKVETGNLAEPQLYDMSVDQGERKNVASEHPDVVAKMQAYIEEVRAKK